MRARRLSLRTRATRLALLVCVGAVALTGCDFSVYSLPLPGGADLGDHPYSVRVRFHDVLDLVPQSSVKVDDVTVGRVDRIALADGTAEVTLLIRDNVRLPANAEAEIRQTSLLGEKFVSLKSPTTGAGTGRLQDGDLIALERTGRNPEVEEVLGAMSLLLNGGGVAQLKTIATELNRGLTGREPDVRSLLNQLRVFIGQLDENRSGILIAIERLNRLARSLNEQKDSVELALDRLPRALASIDRQRDDLVRMLAALDRLGAVGTKVIRRSKVATIDSLRALAPTLTQLAEAGDALPKSLQLFLTYPFVDSLVGTDPTQARNLHMGDYTNLSVQLDLDLAHGLPGLPGLPALPDLCGLAPQLGSVCGVLPDCQKKKNQGDPLCGLVDPVTGAGGLPGGLPGGLSGGSRGSTPGGSPGGGAPAGGSGGACLLGLLCRVAPGAAVPGRAASVPSGLPAGRGADSALGALLVWGMVQR